MRWCSRTPPRPPCARPSCTHHQRDSSARLGTVRGGAGALPKISGVKASPSRSPRITKWTGRSRRPLVLVGADTVYEDGSIQNKIGTLPLVEAARRWGIRRLVFGGGR